MLIGNEKLNTEIVKKELYPIFKKYGIKTAILFGSVAKNKHSIDSDVDILVDSGLHGLKFFGLLEDIVNTINKQIDLIDVSQIKKGSKIEKEIENTGVLIYG